MHSYILLVMALTLSSACGSLAYLQDAEVVPTGEHRVGVGVAGGGGGDDSAFVGAVPLVWTRHGLVGDRLELRTRVTPLPIGASLGLKVGLVGAPGVPGFHLAASADGGAYAFPPGAYSSNIASSAFDNSGGTDCAGDHGCAPQDPAYTVFEGALAFGYRPARRLSLWLTPRVAHLTSLVHDFTQTIVAASVGASGGRAVHIGLELTPGIDVATGQLLLHFALGFEFRL